MGLTELGTTPDKRKINFQAVQKISKKLWEQGIKGRLQPADQAFLNILQVLDQFFSGLWRCKSNLPARVKIINYPYDEGRQGLVGFTVSWRDQGNWELDIDLYDEPYYHVLKSVKISHQGQCVTFKPPDKSAQKPGIPFIDSPFADRLPTQVAVVISQARDK